MAAVNAMSRRSWRTPVRSTPRADFTVTRPDVAEPPRKRLKLATGALTSDNAFETGWDSAGVPPPDHAMLNQDTRPPLDPIKTTGIHHEQDREYHINGRDPPSDAQIEIDDGHDDDHDYQEGAHPFPTSTRDRPRSARPRLSRSRRHSNRPQDTRAPPTNTRSRYSTPATATAATQAHDSYKPREERSWEEFHPDLDLFSQLPVLTADEVDGRSTKYLDHTSPPSSQPGPPDHPVPELVPVPDPEPTPAGYDDDFELVSDVLPAKPSTPAVDTRRSRGRPRAGPDSMLTGLGTPSTEPRIVPIPTHNPKERLNLPKPSFRLIGSAMTQQDVDKMYPEDYVDKSMANVGYQETERFDVPPQLLIRHIDSPCDDTVAAGLSLESDGTATNDRSHPHVGLVEYDMDEQDGEWLQDHNRRRKEEQTEPIKPAIFEITMTQIERAFHALEKRIPKQHARHTATTRPRSGSAAAVNGEPSSIVGEEPDSKCAICDDGDCENANAIIFCDGCDLAVHQECYGVPFIPEGQWFCRKCKEIGRGTPTCIFCPNIEGAFKQTSTMRWSHLLCAIWVPEVTIANPTFMDTIQDVDKVPRSRWGLICYICNQRMGACIQCSKKACYQAFHVTCARRARLFLKMKSSPTSGLDPSVLKALCDKHVPSDWRREHDVDHAIVAAKKYYRKAFKNRRWADSRSVAASADASSFAALQPLGHQVADLTLPQPTQTPIPTDDHEANLLASAKKKKPDNKISWKLPSGAPIVPQVVYDTVETSLTRFTIRKRRDFTAEMCKYWTLKREARRGAALLKRLQLQLESSSAMEVTRKNFAAMGAAGRPRLARRIGFAALLETDLERLQSLVQNVVEREQLKLQDAEHLRHLFDTVYFPLSDLLWPILRKAQKIGEKTRVFDHGFAGIEAKLHARHYISAVVFSHDLGVMFADLVEETDTGPRDIIAIFNSLSKGAMTWQERQTLPQDVRDLRSVSKRIVRAVHPLLESVLQQEAELKGVNYSTLLESFRTTTVPQDTQAQDEPVQHNTIIPSIEASSVEQLGHTATAAVASEVTTTELINGSIDMADKKTSAIFATESTLDDPWAHGGVPWYFAGFKVDGTTVHKEASERAESEALTEIDDVAMQQLENSMSVEHDIATKSAVVNGVESISPDKKGHGRSTTSTRKSRAASQVQAVTRPSRARTSRGKKVTGVHESVDGNDDAKIATGTRHAASDDTGAPESERVARGRKDAYPSRRRALRR